MLGRIFTVGGYTLLSRLTGFARDIMLAAILGATPMADAFFVALRLPNNFRAIFAEGAFNTAFIPAYAHVSGKGGETSARLFADRIFTLLFISQVILLVVAWLFMPQAMSILAPGFTHDEEQRRLAIELTRITFPYLLLITMVTLYGGMLNVMHRFASAAAASIFLNISMMATLALAAFFPTAGHAAAWGVLISGFLQYFLLAGDLARHGGLPRFAPLRLDEDVRAFFRAHRSGHPGLDGHPGCGVRRYHHRHLPRRGRAVGAVLCRTDLSVADRRHRHRDRHGVVAGNVATDHGG